MLRVTQRLARTGSSSLKRMAARSMSVQIPRIGWDKSIQELDPEIFSLIQVCESKQTCALVELIYILSEGACP